LVQRLGEHVYGAHHVTLSVRHIALLTARVVRADRIYSETFVLGKKAVEAAKKQRPAIADDDASSSATHSHASDDEERAKVQAPVDDETKVVITLANNNETAPTSTQPSAIPMRNKRRQPGAIADANAEQSSIDASKSETSFTDEYATTEPSNDDDSYESDYSSDYNSDGDKKV
jgi:hypothetical protein